MSISTHAFDHGFDESYIFKSTNAMVNLFDPTRSQGIQSRVSAQRNENVQAMERTRYESMSMLLNKKVNRISAVRRQTPVPSAGRSRNETKNRDSLSYHLSNLKMISA